MKNILILSVILIGLIACGGKANEGKESLNLLQYGIPITIKAPQEAKVNVEDFGVWKDVTVIHGDSYNVQIISSEASITDPAKIKLEKLNEVRKEPFFSKIIQENIAGFIYEKDIDGTIDYDFRFVKIQGDREFIFQTGLLGTFTEQQVRSMYEAVQ